MINPLLGNSLRQKPRTLSGDGPATHSVRTRAFQGHPVLLQCMQVHNPNGPDDRLLPRGGRIPVHVLWSSRNLNEMLYKYPSPTRVSLSSPSFINIRLFFCNSLECSTTVHNTNNTLNTLNLQWLPQTSSSLFRTTLHLRSQIILQIQMLCSKTPTQNGDMEEHQIIPKHEKCTQNVSICRIHCS